MRISSRTNLVLLFSRVVRRLGTWKYSTGIKTKENFFCNNSFDFWFQPGPLTHSRIVKSGGPLQLLLHTNPNLSNLWWVLFVKGLYRYRNATSINRIPVPVSNSSTCTNIFWYRNIPDFGHPPWFRTLSVIFLWSMSHPSFWKQNSFKTCFKVLKDNTL